MNKPEACFACATPMYLPVNHNTNILANEFDVRSVLHGQESLASAIGICVLHEAKNWLQKSKHSLKACFENVNIIYVQFFLHTKATTALASLRICTDSPVPSLLVNAKHTKIPCADLIIAIL